MCREEKGEEGQSLLQGQLTHVRSRPLPADCSPGQPNLRVSQLPPGKRRPGLLLSCAVTSPGCSGTIQGKKPTFPCIIMTPPKFGLLTCVMVFTALATIQHDIPICSPPLLLLLSPLSPAPAPISPRESLVPRKVKALFHLLSG